VVAATHLSLQESVALKFLKPEALTNSGVVQRFLREAQASVRLKGEHVARISDVGTLPEGTPYIVMEYLHGGDLASILAARGPLAAGEAVDYLLQACEALAEAHALGIVHRDVKPANFFLTRRPDGSPLLKVLDFGISKAPVTGDSDLTRTQTVLGTPAYMSPEQMKSSRDVDARTDIWSLGIVLYECLVGRRPFDAETYSALCLQAAMEPPPPMPAVIPRGLDAVVFRCLEKVPARRYRTVAELAAALAPFAGEPRAAAVVLQRARTMLAGVPVEDDAMLVTAASAPTTLGASAGVAEPPRRGRRRGLAIGAAVLAALAGGVVTASIARRPGSAPPPAMIPDAAPAMVAPAPAAIDAAVPIDAAAVEPAPPATAAPAPTPTPTPPDRPSRRERAGRHKSKPDRRSKAGSAEPAPEDILNSRQ